METGKYVVNPGGVVQFVAVAAAASLLALAGWREPTADELADYHQESLPDDAEVPTPETEPTAEVAIPDMKDGEKDDAFLGRLSEAQLARIAGGMGVPVPSPFDRIALVATLLAKKAEAPGPEGQKHEGE